MAGFNLLLEKRIYDRIKEFDYWAAGQSDTVFNWNTITSVAKSIMESTPGIGSEEFMENMKSALPADTSRLYENHLMDWYYKAREVKSHQFSTENRLQESCSSSISDNHGTTSCESSQEKLFESEQEDEGLLLNDKPENLIEVPEFDNIVQNMQIPEEGVDGLEKYSIIELLQALHNKLTDVDESTGISYIQKQLDKFLKLEPEEFFAGSTMLDKFQDWFLNNQLYINGIEDSELDKYIKYENFDGNYFKVGSILREFLTNFTAFFESRFNEEDANLITESRVEEVGEGFTENDVPTFEQAIQTALTRGDLKPEEFNKQFLQDFYQEFLKEEIFKNELVRYFDTVPDIYDIDFDSFVGHLLDSTYESLRGWYDEAGATNMKESLDGLITGAIYFIEPKFKTIVSQINSLIRKDDIE